MRASRRLILAGLAATALGLGLGASTAGARVAVRPDDMVLGSPSAKVIVMEYASVTCPHCAAWHETVYPAFKRKYVDTGKVRYVFRELPTYPQAEATGGFLVARCAGKTGFFKVVADLMADQPAFYGDMDGPAWLVRAGAKSGMSRQKVLACAGDRKALAAFNARTEANAAADKVNSTPTFFVNGKRLANAELSDLDAAIAPLLAGQR